MQYCLISLSHMKYGLIPLIVLLASVILASVVSLVAAVSTVLLKQKGIITLSTESKNTYIYL